MVFPKPVFANKQTDNLALHKNLDEAKDYLMVLPEKSLSILTDKANLLVVANQEQTADWYNTKLVAAIRVANSDQIYLTLLELSALLSTQYYQTHKSNWLNGIGIWMRRNGFLNDAKISYLCSLQNTDLERNKVLPMLNLGIVENKLGNHDKAKKLYQLALIIAEKYELSNLFAAIENSLGNIALSEKSYSQAQQYYSSALERNEKLMRRSGELVSGLNLLLSFLYQDKLDMFSRLSGRIERKLKRSNTGPQTAYFAILNAVYAARIDESNTADSIEIIKNNMALLNDAALQSLLKDLIGTFDLVWKEPLLVGNQTHREQLRQRFPVCNWDKFSDENYISVLISEFAEPEHIKEN